MTNNNESLVPVVGMPCTYRIGSDRYGAVVTAVKSPKSIEVAMLSGSQPPKVFTLRSNGRWYNLGCAIKDGGSVRLGVAEDYLDPSF